LTEPGYNIANDLEVVHSILTNIDPLLFTSLEINYLDPNDVYYPTEDGIT